MTTETDLQDCIHLLAAAKSLPSLDDIQNGRNGCDKAPTAVRTEVLTDKAPCGYSMTYRAFDADDNIVQQHVRMVVTQSHLIELQQGKVGVT